MTPAALSMAITGILMIAVLGWSSIVGNRLWLPVGIVLYVIAIVFSVAVQAPARTQSSSDLTATPPAPRRPPPPPELPATAKRVRRAASSSRSSSWSSCS